VRYLVGSEVEFDEEECALSPAQASQLLILMSHARTCPGVHKSTRHADVCRAAKYLMLHVRDCDGKVSDGLWLGPDGMGSVAERCGLLQLLDGSPCNFSWCLPCKHLLGHLVRCYELEKCAICSPKYVHLRQMEVGAMQSSNVPMNPGLQGSPQVYGGTEDAQLAARAAGEPPSERVRCSAREAVLSGTFFPGCPLTRKAIGVD
jgi:hypothetical protein